MGGNGDSLQRGHAAHAERAWREVHEGLAEAERSAALPADDLELLASAAYMVGDEDGYVEALGRAHAAHLEAGRPAARCAARSGSGSRTRGAGRSGARPDGCSAPAELLDSEPAESVEHGYLLLPSIFEAEAEGTGRRRRRGPRRRRRSAALRRSDLVALAGHEHGHILIRLGRAEQGVRLLDEAMVAASAGELSPIVTGIVYCGVILACAEILRACGGRGSGPRR